MQQRNRAEKLGSSIKHNNCRYSEELMERQSSGRCQLETSAKRAQEGALDVAMRTSNLNFSRISRLDASSVGY